MAFGDPSPVDFGYFLGRKYAQLQQQADAGTTQAASGAVQAAANATAAKAAAGLDNVKANLLPGESAASIGLQRAQTQLVGNQALTTIPESEARIGLDRANTSLIGTQNKVLTRDGLTERALIPPAGSSRIFGSRGYTGYRLPSSDDRVLPGETFGSAAYLDRINGL